MTEHIDDTQCIIESILKRLMYLWQKVDDEMEECQKAPVKIVVVSSYKL